MSCTWWRYAASRAVVPMALRLALPLVASSLSGVASSDMALGDALRVQAAVPQSANGQGNGYGQGAAAYPPRLGVADTEVTPAMSSQMDADTDSGSKYAKRQSSVQLAMKRVFPSLFPQPSLPVTNK